jgi:hypothetical protein
MIISKAREIFTDVMRDVVILCRFRDSQVMQRGVWEAQVPADIRKRFVDADYVQVDKNIVYLTTVGLEVLEYREAVA